MDLSPASVDKGTLNLLVDLLPTLGAAGWLAFCVSIGKFPYAIVPRCSSSTDHDA